MEGTYRVENGSVYKLDHKANAFIFIGKLNGGSIGRFIQDYEAGL